jgi:hypothetical protein
LNFFSIAEIGELGKLLGTAQKLSSRYGFVFFRKDVDS